MAKLYYSIRAALSVRWPYGEFHSFWYLYHHI